MSSVEFESVVLPHLDAAYNLARYLTRNPTDADDVVQEAILRAATYFGSFRGVNARAWLLQIVRNTAYTRLGDRRAAQEDALDLEGVHAALVDPADDPETALACKDNASVLQRALAALPVELRECVVLRELEEMSYREIARITGVPVGTVMSRLFRARQALLRIGRDAAREAMT